MQTVSSASSTCFRLRSAVECTATVLTPSSRQARRILSAISPRLAMTTLSSIWRPWTVLFDDEQRLTELDRIAVLDQHRNDATRLVRFDLVHHLHRLDDAQDVARLDLAADLDERLRPRGRRSVERADHRRGDGLVR